MGDPIFIIGDDLMVGSCDMVIVDGLLLLAGGMSSTHMISSWSSAGKEAVAGMFDRPRLLFFKKGDRDSLLHDPELL